MRVLIAGIDGFIGWPLAMHLALRGHEVHGIDNISRRRIVAEVGSQSATPISNILNRIKVFNQTFGPKIHFHKGDLIDSLFVDTVVGQVKPEVLIHLAEMPSAPFSMISRTHCTDTMVNNVVGTIHLLYALKEYAPDCHLLKLGTMGEYGTPNLDIPEGFFEVEYNGRKDRLPFPKQPGSWYHLTKVHDTNNILFACKIWGLRATDIMQGVVYGFKTPQMVDPSLYTRFDYDQCFGTAINRFCAEAVSGHPLTVYGAGGQTRGYLPLNDSIQCLTIASENPPGAGEYRVLNQFHECYSVKGLAETVVEQAGNIGIETDLKIENLENPRVEAEKHHYNPEHSKLFALGYRPSETLEHGVNKLLTNLLPFKDRIKKDVIAPTIKWR